MELKTKVNAEEGRQEIHITREFDLPVNMLYKAYTLPELVEQWMGTKVLKMDCRQLGSYRFQTSDPQGNVVMQANGTIHNLVQDSKMVRTFQMENTPFEAQLEFLDFEGLTDTTSKLSIQIIYRSVALRDQMLKLPFAYGISMAHDRLQDIVSKLIK